MELYSYFVFDVVFGEGPLYFSVQKSEYDHPIVKGFKKTEDDKAPPIERLESIQVGDYIIRVNDKDTATMSFSKFKKTIANEPRPLTIRFAKPVPKNEWKRITVDDEVYVQQWATIDMYMPIRTFDLTSIKVEDLPPYQEFKESATILTPMTKDADLFECNLREYCFKESKDMQTRATLWKILLNYYPLSPAKWEEHTKEKVKEYRLFVNEFIIEKNKELGKPDCDMIPNPIDTKWKDELEDRSSAEDNESPWSKQFGDTELRDIIWKDTLRTYSDNEFFTPENHIIFSRMLYIFAKLNSGIKYVQGMNELLAPILLVFSMANQENGVAMSEEVEVEAFYCFNTLMSETKDLFIRQLDSGSTGLNGVFRKFEHYISTHIPEINDVLSEQELHTEFFALRWMTTLFAHDFDLKHTFRLWDSMLADPNRFQFMYCFGTAMLKSKSDEIIANSFSENMKLLQEFQCKSFKKLLKSANNIRIEELRNESGFYEDQTDLNMILDKTKEYFNKTKDIVGEQVKKGWFSFKTVGIPKINELAKTTLMKATEISKDLTEKGKVLGKDLTEKGKVLGKDLTEKGKIFGKDLTERGKEYSQKFMNSIKEVRDNRLGSSVAVNIEENAVTDTSSEEEDSSVTEEDNKFEEI